jgi:hypothetical protein
MPLRVHPQFSAFQNLAAGFPRRGAVLGQGPALQAHPVRAGTQVLIPRSQLGGSAPQLPRPDSGCTWLGETVARAARKCKRAPDEVDRALAAIARSALRAWTDNQCAVAPTAIIVPEDWA